MGKFYKYYTFENRCCQACSLNKYCKFDLCRLHNALSKNEYGNYVLDEAITKELSSIISDINYGWVYRGYIFIVHAIKTPRPCENGCLLYELCNRLKYPGCTIELFSGRKNNKTKIILPNNISSENELNGHLEIFKEVYEITFEGKRKSLLPSDYNFDITSLFD